MNAIKELDTKLDLWRKSMSALIDRFLPEEMGGAGLTDFGVQCGNTAASLKTARLVAERSGWRKGAVDQLAWDVDGDGLTTSWDIEDWLSSPQRSAVPSMDEQGCVGITEEDANRFAVERDILRELDDIRELEADIVREWLRGLLDQIPLSQIPWLLAPEPLSRAQTSAWLQATIARFAGYGLTKDLFAFGTSRQGMTVAIGYGWRLLQGGWTQGGNAELDSLVQRAAAAIAAAEMDVRPMTGVNRLGDFPYEPPRVGQTGVKRVLLDACRWGRMLTDPLTRASGALPGVWREMADYAVLAWWNQAIAETAPSAQSRRGGSGVWARLANWVTGEVTLSPSPFRRHHKWTAPLLPPSLRGMLKPSLEPSYGGSPLGNRGGSMPPAGGASSAAAPPPRSATEEAMREAALTAATVQRDPNRPRGEVDYTKLAHEAEAEANKIDADSPLRPLADDVVKAIRGLGLDPSDKDAQDVLAKAIEVLRRAYRSMPRNTEQEKADVEHAAKVGNIGAEAYNGAVGAK